MPEREHRKQNFSGQPWEILQKIDGIGPRSARRLWDAGFRTFEDLAKRAREDLANITGRPAELIASQNWIGQARELAGPPSEASAPHQHLAAFHVEFLLESDNRVHHTRVRQHQSDAHDAWAGWDQERLLSFLRDHIPLPAAPTPDNAPSLTAHPQAPDQPPQSVLRSPTSRRLPPAAERLLPGPLIIEELASIREGQRSHVQSFDEPSSVRLTMRINPTGRHHRGAFDFSAAFAATEYGSRDRSHIGTTEGGIRVGDSVSVEVGGPALAIGLYRLEVTVQIYAAGHSAEELPIHRQVASGDLMWVADSPLASGRAVA
jgi:hypothetical protein